jgi:hypothetical protein
LTEKGASLVLFSEHLITEQFMVFKMSLPKSMFLTAMIFTFAGVLAKAQFLDEIDASIKAKVALSVVETNLKLENKQEQFQVTETTQHLENGRVFRTVTLNHSGVDTAQLLISAPADFESSKRRFPVVFISAGFFSGMNTVKLLKAYDDLILVGYEYPTQLDAIKKDPSLLPKAIRVVPGQLALALEFLARQAWAKANNIHVVGVSLGTLFFPVALKLAEKRGFTARSTSFLYGGAHPRPVLENLLKNHLPNEALSHVLNIVDGVASVYDPRLYLPLLRGPFLTIYGSKDQVFPKSTSLQQYLLLPDPKETFEIPGSHIDVNQPEAIEQTTKILDDFIQRQI